MTSLYPYSFASANIAANGTLSQAISTNGKKLVGLLCPSTWTSATITFFGSIDGTNFFQIYDYTGTAVSITPVASGLTSMAELWPFPFLKIQSGATGSTVEQTDAVTVELMLVTPSGAEPMHHFPRGFRRVG